MRLPSKLDQFFHEVSDSDDSPDNSEVSQLWTSDDSPDNIEVSQLSTSDDSLRKQLNKPTVN